MQEAHVLIIERVTDISSISEEIAEKIVPAPDQGFRAQVSSDKIGIGDFATSAPNAEHKAVEGEVIKINSKEVDRIIKLLVELKYGDNIIEVLTRSHDVEAKTIPDQEGLDKIKKDVEEFVNRWILKIHLLFFQQKYLF